MTDFGIARLRGSDLVKTQAGFVLATPRASPRRSSSGARRSTAAGPLLHRHPDVPPAHRPLSVRRHRLPAGGERRLPRRAHAVALLEPSLSAALESVVERTLAKDREGRYSTAAEMARALAEVQKAAVAATVMSGAAAAPRLPGEDRHHPVQPAGGGPARRGRRGAELAGPGPWAPGLEEPADRLLDRPLHAPAFAGAALLDDACLFLADGLVLAAVDTRSGETGDAVLEALPAKVRAVLHPVPEGLGAPCVRQLASLLHPPRLRHAGFDFEVRSTSPASSPHWARSAWLDEASPCGCGGAAWCAVGQRGRGVVLSLALPLAERASVDAVRAGDDLVVTVGGHRRVLSLPSRMRRCEVAGGVFDGARLQVRLPPEISGGW